MFGILLSIHPSNFRKTAENRHGSVLPQAFRLRLGRCSPLFRSNSSIIHAFSALDYPFSEKNLPLGRFIDYINNITLILSNGIHPFSAAKHEDGHDKAEKLFLGEDEIDPNDREFEDESCEKP